MRTIIICGQSPLITIVWKTQHEFTCISIHSHIPVYFQLYLWRIGTDPYIACASN